MKKNIQSEEGSVVLLAVMVLMLVTMFGISALNTSDTELRVSFNSRCYKQNLYQAEGIVRETSALINGSPVANLKPSTSAVPWLIDAYQDSPDFDPEDLANNEWENNTNAIASTIYPTEGLLSVYYLGPSQGDTLNMGATKLYEYAIYGKSAACTGEVGVVAGYRQRF